MIFCKKVYTMSVILASASPRRAELLARLGLPFRVHAADLDESSIKADDPAALVQAISAAKAQTVATDYGPDDLILAADTVVALDGRVLGKPRDEADACAMLSALSGRTHTVYTGVTLRKGALTQQFYERSEVTFRFLRDEEIRAYVRSGEPMDKAGAYGIQDLGALLVSSLHGDFYNVMGLPLCRLGEALAAFDIHILEDLSKRGEHPR